MLTMLYICLYTSATVCCKQHLKLVFSFSITYMHCWLCIVQLLRSVCLSHLRVISFSIYLCSFVQSMLLLLLQFFICNRHLTKYTYVTRWRKGELFMIVRVIVCLDCTVHKRVFNENKPASKIRLTH